MAGSRLLQESFLDWATSQPILTLFFLFCLAPPPSLSLGSKLASSFLNIAWNMAWRGLRTNPLSGFLGRPGLSRATSLSLPHLALPWDQC